MCGALLCSWFLYVNTGTAVPSSEFNILLLHSSTTLSEFALICMVQSKTLFYKENTLVILYYLVLDEIIFKKKIHNGICGWK